MRSRTLGRGDGQQHPNKAKAAGVCCREDVTECLVDHHRSQAAWHLQTEKPGSSSFFPPPSRSRSLPPFCPFLCSPPPPHRPPSPHTLPNTYPCFHRTTPNYSCSAYEPESQSHYRVVFFYFSPHHSAPSKSIWTLLFLLTDSRLLFASHSPGYLTDK